MAPRDAVDPAAEPRVQARRQRGGADLDRGHARRFAIAQLEHDVVGLAHLHAVTIRELLVEHVAHEIHRVHGAALRAGAHRVNLRAA